MWFAVDNHNHICVIYVEKDVHIDPNLDEAVIDKYEFSRHCTKFYIIITMTVVLEKKSDRPTASTL